MKKYDALIVFVLDRSGSMGGKTDAVIQHFNQYKSEMQDLPQSIAMSTFLFDDQYEKLYVNQDINTVPALTPQEYYARGSTALLDAIGRTVTSVSRLKGLPEKVVIVVNTDGYENASHEYKINDIKNLVSKYTEKGWQFIFAGAGIDAFGAGESYGFASTRTFSGANTAKGYDDYYNVLASASTSYVTGATPTLDTAAAAATLQIDDGNPDKKKKAKSST